MIRMQKILPLVALGLAVGGCAAMPGNSDYACQGMPDTATCISAREAYERTNDPNTYKRQPPDTTKSEPSKEETKENPSQGEGNPVAVQSPPPGKGGAPQVFIQDGNVPVRTPAYVMRIWVGTWEDGKGDLHMPGFIYTEIAPRRWQVGLPSTVSANSGLLRPLEAPQTAVVATTNTQPAPASGAKKQK